MIRQLVAQLSGAGSAPIPSTAVARLSMLAMAQSLPQNKGQLCPLVPEGEEAVSVSPAVRQLVGQCARRSLDCMATKL
jgi:hypothetical protein